MAFKCWNCKGTTITTLVSGLAKMGMFTVKKNFSFLSLKKWRILPRQQKKIVKIPQEENKFYPNFSWKKIRPKKKLVLAWGHWVNCCWIHAKNSLTLESFKLDKILHNRSLKLPGKQKQKHCCPISSDSIMISTAQWGPFFWVKFCCFKNLGHLKKFLVKIQLNSTILLEKIGQIFISQSWRRKNLVVPQILKG